MDQTWITQDETTASGQHVINNYQAPMPLTTTTFLPPSTHRHERFAICITHSTTLSDLGRHGRLSIAWLCRTSGNEVATNGSVVDYLIWYQNVRSQHK